MHQRLLLLSSVSLALGCAMPAFAQEASSAEDIVVTARRVEERLQDVPISVAVFNQEQLTNANVVNAADLATITPSLSANTNFGSQNSSFAIRGFVQDNGTAPSVGVYFADVVAPRGVSNGLPAGDGAGAGSFFDLQNVQVLRGPQGTLFGRNTTGGAVLLVPRRPTEDFEGYIEGGIGNYDMRRVQGVLNAPLGESVRLRLGFDHQEREGYVNNTSGVGPSDFNDVDYTALRGSLLFDFSPTIENYTVVSYTDSETNGSFQKLVRASLNPPFGALATQQLAVQGGDFYDAQQDLIDPQTTLNQWQVVNRTTWDVNSALTLTNIISYAELVNDLHTPLFGTAFSTPDLTFISPLLPAARFGFSSVVPIPGGHTSNQSTFTEELRLTGDNFDDRLSWQAGAYLEVSEPRGLVGSQSPVGVSCVDSATFQCTDYAGFIPVALGFTTTYTPGGVLNYTAGETTFQNQGVYLQGSFELTDQWSVTAGYRYTWDRQKNESIQRTYLINPPVNIFDPGYDPTNSATWTPLPPGTYFNLCTNPEANPTTCRIEYSMHSEAPTWMVGVDFTPTDDLLFYAKYTRGYRAGTIAPNVTSPYNIVRPEQVDAYEIGSKWTFRGNMPGVFNTALFFNDFQDQQLQLGFNPAIPGTVTPTAAPINAGQSEIYGAELELTIEPFDGFTVRAGYTYLHTEITEIPTFPTPSGALYVVAGQQRPGDPLALSPENKFTLSANYELPLPESLGRITLGGTYVYTDEQQSNYDDRNVAGFEDLSVLEATNIFNVNLSWESIAGAPVDLLLFGANVTDEEYYAYVPGLASGTGFETAVLGQPRMYGAQLRYRFGG